MYNLPSMFFICITKELVQPITSLHRYVFLMYDYFFLINPILRCCTFHCQAKEELSFVLSVTLMVLHDFDFLSPMSICTFIVMVC